MEFNHRNTESVARKANLGGVVLPFARSPPASNLKISLKEVKVAKQGAGNGLVCSDWTAQVFSFMSPHEVSRATAVVGLDFD